MTDKPTVEEMVKYVSEHIAEALTHTIGEIPARKALEEEVSRIVGMPVRFPDYDEKTGEATEMWVTLPLKLNFIKTDIVVEEVPVHIGPPDPDNIWSDLAGDQLGETCEVCGATYTGLFHCQSLSNLKEIDDSDFRKMIVEGRFPAMSMGCLVPEPLHPWEEKRSQQDRAMGEAIARSYDPHAHKQCLTTEDRDGNPCTPVCAHCGAAEEFCKGEKE